MELKRLSDRLTVRRTDVGGEGSDEYAPGALGANDLDLDAGSLLGSSFGPSSTWQDRIGDRGGAIGVAALALVLGIAAFVVLLRSRPAPVVVSPRAGAVAAHAHAGERTSAATATAVAGTVKSGTTPAGQPVTVHVAGAVIRPGILTLPAGARVADAVRAAHPAPDSAPDALNLARVLVDAERVYVPRAGEPAPPAPVAPSETTRPPPVDLNSATAAQLDALPGIGPVLAARIVEHRTKNGAFASLEELEEVAGIGTRLIEALRDLVVVGRP